eukprot:CAMPEP_0201987570 /NCGR_PEP_ID=MMETSP0904-20121228/91868_1 /ASSEMBLY_ACC=CAM_ASM_000553 /TAXON_ID=420261 /ORGANISM="Thalassiosira antarctica, Strain CCMP982" /LENGTH=133 /DNA_ID=CAMNT_0048541691 /DNA_START=515 /DNA_END=914 /DNA_ORIENTATION=-
MTRVVPVAAVVGVAAAVDTEAETIVDVARGAVVAALVIAGAVVVAVVLATKETIAPLAAAMSTAHRAVEGGTRTRIGSVLRGVMVVPKLNDPKEGIEEDTLGLSNGVLYGDCGRYDIQAVDEMIGAFAYCHEW